VSTEQTVEFTLPDGTHGEGICRNLGLGGCCIETSAPAPFGSEITIFLELYDLPRLTPIKGVVRWTKPNTMGVQFALLGARITHAILATLSAECRQSDRGASS